MKKSVEYQIIDRFQVSLIKLKCCIIIIIIIRKGWTDNTLSVQRPPQYKPIEWKKGKGKQ